MSIIEDELRTSRTSEDWLITSGKYVASIVQATTSIEALRATVEAICDVCGIASAWVEVSQQDEYPSLVIAAAGEDPKDVDKELGRASYPLNIQMPGWRTARLVVRQSADHLRSSSRSSRLAALLSILDQTISRISETDSLIQATPDEPHHLEAEETRFLEDLQHLTSGVSTATNLAHLCEMVHETLVRFVPAERVVIQANLRFAPDADVFVWGEIPDGKPVQTIESEMTSNDGLVGRIRAQRVAKPGFDFHHQAIMDTIAQSICGAFERQMLLDWAALQTRQETALRTAAVQFNQTFDQQDLLNIAADIVYKAISADTLLVVLVESTTCSPFQRVARFRTVQRELPPPHTPLPRESMVYQSLQDMQTVTIFDAIDRDYPTFRREPWKHFVAAASTPFMVNESTSGFILTCYTERSEMLDTDVAFAEQVSAMLATALASAQAHAERIRHTQDLGELQRLGAKISEPLDLNQSLDAIVESAVNLVQADGGAIGMNIDGHVFTRAEAGSVRGKLPPAFRISGTIVEEIISTGKPVIMNDLPALWSSISPGTTSAPPAASAMVVPLIDNDDEEVGAIAVFSSQPRIWTEREATLLTALSATAAIAIKNARQFERTRDLLRASIESLAAAVEAKDPGTRNHSRNVANYARVIANEMNLYPEVVDSIELAALLHDVGKIGIPDTVLNKPGKLDSADWAAIQLHPVIGEQILSGNPELEHLLPMVRHHHERWDGHGYPDRIAGRQIPIGAAVIAVAETLDALTTARPYQEPISWRDAFEEIRAERGSQFAPMVVDAFISAYRAAKFPVVPHEVNTGSLQRPVRERNRAPSLDVRALRIFESVALQIRGGQDLRSFLDNVVNALREILGFGYISIFTLESEDASLELMASYPPVPDEEAFMKPIREGLGNVNWVARTGQTVNIADVSKDSRYLDGAMFPGGSELCVPLLADGRVVGVLNLESERLNAFSEAEERLMVSASDYIATAINVVQLHERLKTRSTTDALTGLANHRVFYDQLVAETRRSQMDGTSLSVAILDIDNLKAINDSYGHLVGDAALRAVAEVLHRHCRPDDLLSRYGGDEFAVIMPRTSRDEAWDLVESIASALESEQFETENIILPLPTASWGVATAPSDGQRSIELLAVADERMYTHKNQGRS